MNDEFEDRPRVVADAGYTAQKLNRPGEKSLGANNLASLAKSVLQADATTTENNMLKIATNSSRKGTRTAVTKPKPRGGLAARKMELEQEAKNNSTTPAPDAAKPKRGKKNKVEGSAKSKNSATAKPRKAKSDQLYGYNVCPVLRALGKAKVTKRHAMAIMAAKGIKVTEATVNVHIYQGKTKAEGKNIAPLSEAQLDELKALAADPDAAETSATA